MGYGAIGKTYLADKYKNVADIEMGDYHYTNKGFENVPVELRKGNQERRKDIHPDWPENYINAVMSATLKYDIVLCGMPKFLREYLRMENIEFYYVFPTKEAKDECFIRAKNRGNNDFFISDMAKNYDKWFDEIIGDNKKILWMKSGQYLENVLTENGLLKQE